MKIQLSFLGAAKNVTGSRFLLDADGSKVLVDCGLYQERQFRSRNWDRFPVDPASIDAVLLTHAHLDHCGLLPKLVREGFSGPIYCTAATAQIAQIILLDSAHIQEEDAAYKAKRHRREGRTGPHPEVPLYTTADAEAVEPLFKPVKYDKPVELGAGVRATFRDAGHVLGSAFIAVHVDQDGDERTVLFSGDVGRRNKPIIEDPQRARPAEYALCESTYGDRVHPPPQDVAGHIERIVNETVEAGGNVVIPSFALERAQEVLYHLNDLRRAKRIPPLLVFLDSPMAIRITRVFQEHPELYDDEMRQAMAGGRSPFDFPGLQMTQSTDASKGINRIRGSAVIIAGSGMCTGGRIKHHLVNNIARPENTILFVGYQAAGTLGRILVDGVGEVRIHGRMHPVEARIEQIHGLSAHADRGELLGWLRGLGPDPRKVFVVHGEAGRAERFAEFLRDEADWDVVVPDYKDTVKLS